MSAQEYSAVFSIDVEDWYHGIELPRSRWADQERRISIGLEAILGLLERHGTHGTFFILGWIAENHPEIVKRIAERGHELASHGYSHEKVYDLTPDEFRSEVRRTKQLLEELGGKPVIAHRSPFFSITKSSLWALEILKEEGYLHDCSISPVKTWRYGIAGSPDRAYRIAELGLIEFPVSTIRVFTKKLGLGGAYFRILPSILTERGLDRSLREHHQAIFYAHPWEYDPGHPRIAGMEPRARLTHYFNLKSTYPKTDRLLKRYKFKTLSRAIKDLQADDAIPDLPIDSLKR